MSDFWQHILIAGIVVVVTLVVAKLLDRWLVHRLNLSPNAMTRYSVIRRTVPDNGKFNDNLGMMTGTFTYQVCETDSGDCSNEVDVTFP